VGIQEVVRDVATGPLSEAELNALGTDHWELVGMYSAGAQIHFYFSESAADRGVRQGEEPAS
jgi:hypothetical protein